MNIKKKKYVAPALTIVAFSTERGYAISASEATQWTGWRIQQELVMINAMGDRVTSENGGDLTASTFTSGGTIDNGGGWLTDGESGWF